MADIDKAISKIEAGNAWNEGDEVVEIEVKKPLDRVIPVRLSADKWEEMRREAKKLGVGPTTLARMWLLERLSHQIEMERVVRKPLNIQNTPVPMVRNGQVKKQGSRKKKPLPTQLRVSNYRPR